MESVIASSALKSIWIYTQNQLNEKTPGREVIRQLSQLPPNKCLDYLITNFDVLNQPDEGDDPAKLTRNMQEGFVHSLIGKKSSYDLSIRLDEMVTMFSALPMHIKQQLPDYVKNALPTSIAETLLPQVTDPELVQPINCFADCLNEGVNRFNQKTDHKIAVSTVQFDDFSNEVLFHLISHQQSDDRFSLAGTTQLQQATFRGFYESRLDMGSGDVMFRLNGGLDGVKQTAYQIDRDCPWLRKPQFLPYDPQGIAYINTFVLRFGCLSIELGGPLLNQKLRNGKGFTISMAVEQKTKIIKELLEKLPTLPEEIQQFYNSVRAKGLIKYIADETLTLKRALTLNSDQIDMFEKEGVHFCLDNDIFSLEELLDLPAYSHKAVTKALGLAILEFRAVKIFFSGREILNLSSVHLRALSSSPVLQGYIKNKLISLEKFKTLTVTQIEGLLNKGFQKLINNGNGVLAMEEAIELHADANTKAITILGTPEFVFAINNKEMSLKDAINYTYTDAVIFIAGKRADTSDVGARKYLEKKWLTQKAFDSLTESQKANFNMLGIQNALDNRIITTDGVLNCSSIERFIYNCLPVLNSVYRKISCEVPIVIEDVAGDLLYHYFNEYDQLLTL